MQGSTFTITNPVRSPATPPRRSSTSRTSPILCTDGVKRRPVAVGDAIAIHPTGIIGLVYDHRAFDGSTASLFLRGVRDSLEQRELGGGGQLTGVGRGAAGSVFRGHPLRPPGRTGHGHGSPGTLLSGREADFADWNDELTAGPRRTIPGFLGAGRRRPSRVGDPGTSSSGSTRRSTCTAWEASPERTALTDGDDLVEATEVHRVCGLETCSRCPAGRHRRRRSGRCSWSRRRSSTCSTCRCACLSAGRWLLAAVPAHPPRSRSRSPPCDLARHATGRPAATAGSAPPTPPLTPAPAPTFSRRSTSTARMKSLTPVTTFPNSLI